jgi:hypothetical protein
MHSKNHEIQNGNNFTEHYHCNNNKSDVANPGPRLGQKQKYGGVKPDNGIPPSPLGNWISSGKADIHNQKTYTAS